jgi:hypothetical protein
MGRHLAPHQECDAPAPHSGWCVRLTKIDGFISGSKGRRNALTELRISNSIQEFQCDADTLSLSRKRE